MLLFLDLLFLIVFLVYNFLFKHLVGFLVSFQQEIKGRCNGTCDVTVESRSYCKRCRLQKCLKVGMKRELILSKKKALISLLPDELLGREIQFDLIICADLVPRVSFCHFHLRK